MRRWIALLVLAAVCFAAAGAASHATLWAILVPVLIVVLELIALREEAAEFQVALAAGCLRLRVPARAPPLP